MTSIKPSPAARRLFGSMVAASKCCYLPLAQAIKLGAQMAKEGKDPQHSVELAELIDCGWVASASDGGWDLSPGARSRQRRRVL